MGHVTLNAHFQKLAEAFYDTEESVLKMIDALELHGETRWSKIGRTDIEKGFMALRKAVTELNKAEL